MKIEGGCYCGKVRFEAEGDPVFKGQCHCRECQYISGGHPNAVMGMPEGTFRYTTEAAREFRRSDLDNPVTREFCGDCGTPILSRAPSVPGLVLLKVGSFDDPALYGGPDMVIYTCDAQSFHQMPDGVPTFEKVPG